MTQAQPGELAVARIGGGSGRRMILTVISLAQLMITLDSTIVSVALPSLQHSVGLSDASRQWAVTAYTVAFGGLLVLGGRVGDLVGRRRTLFVGVIGFALASAVGGAAMNTAMFITARAIQGACAALIAPSALALINTIFAGPKERAKALAVFTAIAMSGGALGLVLGGVLADYLGWRWCLFVNIPLGILVLVGGIVSVPKVAGRPGERLDVLGVILGTGGMFALIYALGEGGQLGWGSPAVVGALVAAGALLATFQFTQARRPNPLVPPPVLANRNSGAAFIVLTISAFTTYGMLLGMTYQLQVVMGYSPVRTGLAFLAYVVTAVIYTTQIATRLVRRIRICWLVAVGLGIFVIALLLLTRLTPRSTYFADVFPALILFGIGVGTLTVPTMTAVMSTTDREYLGVVSALVNTAQQAGGSIGAALLNTISISAAASFLATNPKEPSATLNANVHGFAIACLVSAAMAAAGAIIGGVLITVDARTDRF